MLRRLTALNLLQNLTLCIVAFAVVANTAPAQEKEATESAQKAADSDDAKEADEVEEELFPVPEGTAAELFAFMNKVKRTRPKERTREASAAHLKLQIEAVLAACDKVMDAKPDEATEIKVINEKLGALGALARVDQASAGKQLKALMEALESDERPAIVSLLAAKKLEQKASSVARMSDKDRMDFIEELFGIIAKNGLDRTTYGIASNVGRALSRTDKTEVGAVMYERLADAMEKSDDAAMSSRAERTRGSARRLRLPGNFMEIKGTTADGEDFDWAAYRGKVVLVDFWASWCGPCRAEIPNMKANLEKYGDKGFAILGVNLDNTKAAYEKYVEREELTWTNLMSDNDGERGWDNPLVAHYGVSGIPTAILVDEEGKVISMSARGSQLNKLLEDRYGPVEEPTETESVEE